MSDDSPILFGPPKKASVEKTVDPLPRQVPDTGNSPVAGRLAMPGDPDLDADVDGLTVTAVVANPDSREILIHLVDGFGRFVDSATGDMRHFPPGDESARVTETRISVRVPAMSDRVWADYVGQLEAWRDRGTPLRLCSAPGRVTLLIEDRSTFLPIPRRPDPAVFRG